VPALVNSKRIFSGLAILGFYLSLTLMLIGIIGFQVTTQDNFEQIISISFSFEQGGQDPVSEMYDDLAVYCQAYPDSYVDLESEGPGIPLIIYCNELEGMDLDGFRDYLVSSIADLLWYGEITMSEIFVDDGGDMGGIEAVFELFTFKGNAMLYALILLAMIPATGFAAAVISYTEPGRRVRRFGMFFLISGLTGLVTSLLVFSVFSLISGEGGEGPEIGAILDIFSGSFYYTFAVMLIIGIILFLIHLLQKRMAEPGELEGTT